MRVERRHPRGLTLIEVMTTVAIFSIIMLAAMSIMVTIIGQRRQAERLIDIQSAGVMSLSQMEGDLTNAGYRWPAAMFAVRVHNAPNSLNSGGNLGIIIDQAGGCGTGGLKPGSDVVEITTGNTGFAPGETQGIQPGVSPLTDYRIVLAQFGSGPGATVPPYDLLDNALGVVLLTDDSGESCIGRVTSGPAGGTVLNITMLDRDYNDVTDKLVTYPNCLAGVTPSRSRVYRLAERTRYMVCQDQTLAGVQIWSLFRQVSDANGVFAVPPALVQSGVDDLQISSRVYARSPPLVATGNDCFPGSAGGEAYCFCNESPGSACDLSADPLPGVLTRNSWAAWLSALRVTVSATGARPMADVPSAQALTLKDFVPPTSPDGHRRVAMDLGIGLTNLVQVVP